MIMKTVDEVLKSWLLEKFIRDPEQARIRYDEVKARFKSTSIRSALKDNSCTSYESFISLCKFYESRKPLPPIWQPPV